MSLSVLNFVVPEEAQEFFRECGGINFVLNLLTSTQDSRVKIASLYMLGCACEKNGE